MPYSKAGDPSGAAAGEDALKIRALLVDGVLKEWTTGDTHDVTDRSFVVRRVIRLNDALPTDKPPEKPAPNSRRIRQASHWVWQRGPWLLVDRVTGHVTALHLPDYDPGVSQVSWFRDYAAYCGVTASGKSLYAVVAQLAGAQAGPGQKARSLRSGESTGPACAPPDWQREPLRITFHPAGKDAVSYDFVPGSAVLVDDSGDEEETPAPARGKIAKSRERVSVRPVRSRGSRCASVSRSLRMGERRTAIGPASVALIPSRDAASWNRQMIGSGDDPGVALPSTSSKAPTP